jgi:phosphatidylethanolamine/phosphatidyl-N-methylethanolamine N-methyltransferase
MIRSAHQGRLTAMKSNARRLSTFVSDEVRFFRAWIEKPLTMGSVTPSSPFLTKAIAAQAEIDRPGKIVELGPGTGVVTDALVARGVPQERLVLIEYNGEFCTLLRKRFPGATVIEGDAYDFDRTLGDPADGSLATVISGLPLFTKPIEMRRSLMDMAFRLLAPGAPFVQFSYALVPPVPAEAGRTTIWTSPWILRNVPPARVWVYRSETVPA